MKQEKQKTFAMIKPDAVQRSLVGEIISRFEKKGLKITGLKIGKMSQQQAEKLYAAHEGKDFYAPLIKFATSSPAVFLVLEGPEAIQAVRKIVGDTNSVEAQPGSIRGDLSLSGRKNCVHAADSKESAERESKIFFKEDELLKYDRIEEPWNITD